MESLQLRPTQYSANTLPICYVGQTNSEKPLCGSWVVHCPRPIVIGQHSLNYNCKMVCAARLHGSTQSLKLSLLSIIYSCQYGEPYTIIFMCILLLLCIIFYIITGHY